MLLHIQSHPAFRAIEQRKFPRNYYNFWFWTVVEMVSSSVFQILQPVYITFTDVRFLAKWLRVREKDTTTGLLIYTILKQPIRENICIMFHLRFSKSHRYCHTSGLCSQNYGIFWFGRDPQESSCPALKWMASTGIKLKTGIIRVILWATEVRQLSTNLLEVFSLLRVAEEAFLNTFVNPDPNSHQILFSCRILSF